MEDGGEYRRQTLKDRIKSRLEYTFRPTGPVSKEVLRQIRKIQDVIPYGSAWEGFEKVKADIPRMMKETDDRFRNESFWHNLKTIVNVIFFYSPLVVWLTGGTNPAAAERKKVRTAAKEWKTYLTKNPEGKRLVSARNRTGDPRRIHEIVTRIISGEPPAGGARPPVRIYRS